METLRERILATLAASPGLTDREITNALHGLNAPQQSINQAARALEAQRLISRRRRHDGLIGNFLMATTVDAATLPSAVRASAVHENHDVEALSEEDIKRRLVAWLAADGWTATVAWAKQHGVDIDARRGEERWVIEVKGPGSRPPMRVNYFVGILGETLQRMNDPDARYSIALPELAQFRRLWERLPELAKTRTGVSAIFVSKAGDVAVAS
jgi:DNA-binding MarR family transcriptional regulator